MFVLFQVYYRGRLLSLCLDTYCELMCPRYRTHQGTKGQMQHSQDPQKLLRFTFTIFCDISGLLPWLNFIISHTYVLHNCCVLYMGQVSGIEGQTQHLPRFNLRRISHCNPVCFISGAFVWISLVRLHATRFL